MVITNLGAVSMNVSGDFTFANSPVEWLTAYAVTSSTLPNYGAYNVQLGDGSTQIIYAFSAVPKVNVKSINYLGN